MKAVRRTLVLATVVSMVSCGDPAGPGDQLDFDEVGELPDPAGDPPPVERGDLLLSVDLYGPDGPEPPYRLYFEGRARNVSTETAELSELCIVQYRAYELTEGVAIPSPSEPDWRRPSGEVPGCVDPSERKIPPASPAPVIARDGLAQPDIGGILGDSLPGGRYELTVLMRVDGEPVEVPAGSVHLARPEGSPLRDPHRLTYSVSTELEGAAPRTLVTRVVAGNETGAYAYLEFGSCALRLRAYPTSDLSGSPVWRSEAAEDPSGFPRVCPTYLAERLVAPGAVISPHEFTAANPVPEILGDSLPDGRYHFAAELGFLQSVVRLPAGSAELSSSVEPLPFEQQVGPIRYGAHRSGTDEGLQVTVTATNTSADPAWILGTGVAGCGAQLWGFETSDARDGWYLASEPDWYSGACSLELDPIRLAPGESQTFDLSFPAPPAAVEFLAIRLWLEATPGPEFAPILLAVE